MTELKEKKSLSLSRNISLKAIVTDDFKKYYILEMEERLKVLKNQFDQIDKTLEDIVKKLTSQNLQKRIPEFEEGSLREKSRLSAEIDGIEKQIEYIKSLAINSLFQQGPLQGLVTVHEGDNLYQKISSAEIIVKDGIIQEIKEGI